LADFDPEGNIDPEEPLHPGGFIRNMNPFVYVIIVLGIIFFLYQIVGGIISVAAGGGIEDMDVKTSRIILSFSQFMFILAPTLFFARFQTSEIKEMFRLHVPSPAMIILAIAGIILIQPALQGYMLLQDKALNHIPFINDFVKQIKDLFDLIEKAELKIVTAYSRTEFVVVVFVICLTPAICEEFLFRGFVFKNLQKISKPGVAIFLQSFLFALYHFQPLNLVPLIMLGAFLGFAVYCSNSIYTSLLCHFLNNFFASYLLFVYGKEDFETPHISQSETIDAVMFFIVSLLLFGMVAYTMYKMRTVKEGVSG